MHCAFFPYTHCRLRSLKKMIVERESAASEKEKMRQKAMEEEQICTKRLGRIPYPTTLGQHVA